MTDFLKIPFWSWNEITRKASPPCKDFSGFSLKFIKAIFVYLIDGFKVVVRAAALKILQTPPDFHPSKMRYLLLPYLD